MPGCPHLLGLKHLPLKHIGDAVSNHLQPACAVAVEPAAPLQDGGCGKTTRSSLTRAHPGPHALAPFPSPTHGGPRGHSGPPLSLHSRGRALHLGCRLVHDPLHHAVVQPGEGAGRPPQVAGLPRPLHFVHSHGGVWVLLQRTQVSVGELRGARRHRALAWRHRAPAWRAHPLVSPAVRSCKAALPIL